MPKDLRGGFETYWTTYGQGPRAALMLHCSLAHSGAWSGMARGLSGALTMTAFDQPGHGRSADWSDHGEMQGVCTAMALDLLGGKPADIIGHSFGATVALRLATSHPELVRSLTLIEPVLFGLAAQDFPEHSEEYTIQMQPYIDAVAKGDMALAAQEFMAVWGDGRAWEELAPETRESLTARIHLVQANDAAVIEDIAGVLKPEALARVTMPVLLVEGSLSPSQIGLINAGLARRLPDATRAVIAGAGHMAPITHPEAVSAEVLALLRRS